MAGEKAFGRLWRPLSVRDMWGSRPRFGLAYMGYRSIRVDVSHEEIRGRGLTQRGRG